MMDNNLSSGKGACDPRALITLSLTNDCLEMGESANAVRKILAAVHHVNRTGGGSRVMIDAPDYRQDMEGLVRIGRRISLIGEASDIEAVCANRALARLVRNGALEATAPAPCPPPSHGLKRIRRGEKSTPAGMARARRRVERRGGIWEDRPHRGAGLRKLSDGTAFVSFDNGRRIEFIRSSVDGDLAVSTYGMI